MRGLTKVRAARAASAAPSTPETGGQLRQQPGPATRTSPTPPCRLHARRRLARPRPLGERHVPTRPKLAVPAAAQVNNCLIRVGILGGDGVPAPTITCCILNFYASRRYLMPTTPNFEPPYPLDTDPADAPRVMDELAVRLDTALDEAAYFVFLIGSAFPLAPQRHPRRLQGVRRHRLSSPAIHPRGSSTRSSAARSLTCAASSRRAGRRPPAHAVGAQGGFTQHTLSPEQMPPHAHTVGSHRTDSFQQPRPRRRQPRLHLGPELTTT